MLDHQESLKSWYKGGKVMVALTSYIAASSVDVVACDSEFNTTYRVYHCFIIGETWNISVHSEITVGKAVDTSYHRRIDVRLDASHTKSLLVYVW